VAVAAKARAQHETAVAEPVERDRLARQLLNAPARKRRHERSEHQALGRARRGAERDPGVGDIPRRRGVADVVPQEEAIPPALLGARGKAGHKARVGELVEGGHEHSTPGAHAGPQ